jgi:hypothetical protein
MQSASLQAGTRAIFMVAASRFRESTCACEFTLTQVEGKSTVKALSSDVKSTAETLSAQHASRADVKNTVLKWRYITGIKLLYNINKFKKQAALAWKRQKHSKK